MATERIDRVWPTPAAAALDDRALIECYAIDDREQPSARLNFVSSVDGAATADGLTAGLSSIADKRVFDHLRMLCDTVLVGAGTVRAEGYGAMRLGDASVQWRRANGLPDHPVFSIVSRSLDLDPASPVFVEAPASVIVATIRSAPGDRRAALARVADVVICGDERLDVRVMLAELAKRGLRQVLSEGGPTLFGSFIDADCVDELCLTVSPLIEGGAASRIAVGAHQQARRMALEHVLVAGDTLMLKYRRGR